MSRTCLQRSIRHGGLEGVHLPIFLVPAFASAATVISYPLVHASRSYASIAPDQPKQPKQPKVHLRNTRDKNKNRGVSIIRRTGPKVPLSVSKLPLPRPNRDPQRRKEFLANPDHGLWGFFPAAKTSMDIPEEEHAHGRSWTYQELSNKSFGDLHSLYWVGIKERNRIATSAKERGRVNAGYGAFEGEERDKTVKMTLRNIRQVLEARFYNVQEAQRIIRRTPVADLNLELDVDQYEDIDEVIEKAPLAESHQTEVSNEQRLSGATPSTSSERKTEQQQA